MPPKKRVAFLEKHSLLVESRDDLYLEYITLCNLSGHHQKAKDLIGAYKFHPWEGGEGKAVGQYLVCHLELAKQAIERQDYDKAVDLLLEAEDYPSNLGEGKLYGEQENDLHYLTGIVLEKQGKQQLANEQYILATLGISEPVQAIFYNDPQPDKVFYQGLAWLKLNEPGKATDIFTRLITFGEAHMDDSISIDYFAVSLPDLLVFDTDLDLRNKIHCLYLMALGNLGLGNGYSEKAEHYFNKILKEDINHQGAIIHKQMKNYTWFVEHVHDNQS